MGAFGDIISADASTEDIDGGRQKQFTAEDLALVNGDADGEQQTSKDAPSLASVEEELAAINQKRRDDRRAYFKDEGLQARERELLTLRQKLQSGSAEKSDDDDGLPDELLSQWEKSGGVEQNLKAAQDTALIALDALEGEEQADLIASFDELPVEVHARTYAFLSIDPAPPAKTASDAEVEQFASLPEGQALVREWGRAAPRNLAVVRSRLNSILSGMSEGDRERASEWFDSLSERQAAAVLRSLAGKPRR